MRRRHLTRRRARVPCFAYSSDCLCMFCPLSALCPPLSTFTGILLSRPRRQMFGGAPVFSFNNFFPRDLAERWRDTFDKEYDAGTFQLATNNDGSLTEARVATRNIAAIKEWPTSKLASQMHKAGQFAYAKHNYSCHAVLRRYQRTCYDRRGIVSRQR